MARARNAVPPAAAPAMVGVDGCGVGDEVWECDGINWDVADGNWGSPMCVWEAFRSGFASSVLAGGCAGTS